MRMLCFGRQFSLNFDDAMELLFHYMSAVVTRSVFCIHAVLFIHWLAAIKQDPVYYTMLMILGFLVVEGAYTVGYRKGHEYRL